MEFRGASDFITPNSNSLTVEVSGSSSLTTPKALDDQEWTDIEGDVSSSADAHDNGFSSISIDTLAAHLEEEFRQYLVERGVYKELEDTASRVLEKLLQSKRADGTPLLLLNTGDVPPKDSSTSKASGSTDNKAKDDKASKEASAPPPSTKKPANNRTRQSLCNNTKPEPSNWRRSSAVDKRKESCAQNNSQRSERRATIATPKKKPDQTSSGQGSSKSPGSAQAEKKTQSEAAKTLSDILQDALISLNHRAKIGIHLSNQLGMIVTRLNDTGKK
ncbi:uncharacterized protein LOC134445924 [Engraulis encrasicolus]|uniref:uncharacterized protein LOC134445924 n=1 Tax=Engraulis encrasicolus TaxID=184585 RepID=UPI002FD57413